ncbi:Fic family protein [Streptomyces sp. NPDC085540]|uniref:Fic family protein n=1 Tax=Streptomyces sp. NPDC085540 TaxID=3365730 RepID=UPI0037CE740C
MTTAPTTAVRRIRPVVPPLDAACIPDGARARAHDALATLAEATASHLDHPDLFHRPRIRTRLHLRHVDPATPALLAERLTDAAEARTTAGLLAVASVRDELRERPGRRPCFTPTSLAALHRMLVAGDPNVPGPGGFRRAPARITWPDGRRFAITVAPGRALHGHVERWYRWAVRSASPALDAAAFGMLRLFTVHPFPDGNGRTARLLAQCDLVGAALLPGLLLDVEGWVDAHRAEHDEAVVAGAEGEWEHWGALFARAVTETARHRTATVTAYGNLLDEALDHAACDPAAAEVLRHFRSGPAVSAPWLRGRTAHDPGPALARLRDARILVAHPRLRDALVHPGLLALLDAPYEEAGAGAAVDTAADQTRTAPDHVRATPCAVSA